MNISVYVFFGSDKLKTSKFLNLSTGMRVSFYFDLQK